MKNEILCKLQQAIPEELDGIMIENMKHQFYLCGFDFTDGYLVVCRDAAYLFVDFRYIEAARAAICEEDFTIFDKTTLTFVHSTLQKLGIRKLGFEDRYLTVADLQHRKVALLGIELSPIGGLIENMRLYKTEPEFAAIRKAQKITDEAFDHILGFITPERTETEIALELEFFMRRRGAVSTSFSTICVSGKKSSLPHGVPSDRKIERGFLTMDFGCIFGGYCSDMTRTVSVGSVTDEERRVYETVLGAQQKALEFIDWHKSCFECDKVARDFINAAGYEGAFGHSLGHGVGLYIHESPRLSAGAPIKDLLENGHVVTCEPGIYLEGKFGVRIEDMVLIHDNAAENITKSPKELIIL